MKSGLALGIGAKALSDLPFAVEARFEERGDLLAHLEVIGDSPGWVLIGPDVSDRTRLRDAVTWVSPSRRVLDWVDGGSPSTARPAAVRQAPDDETPAETRRILSTLIGNMPGMMYRCEIDRR